MQNISLWKSHEIYHTFISTNQPFAELNKNAPPPPLQQQQQQQQQKQQQQEEQFVIFMRTGHIDGC